MTGRCFCCCENMAASNMHMHQVVCCLHLAMRFAAMHVCVLLLLCPCSNPDGTYSGTFSLKTDGFDDIITQQDYEQLLSSRFAGIPDQWIQPIAEQTIKQQANPAGECVGVINQQEPDKIPVKSAVCKLLSINSPCPAARSGSSSELTCGGVEFKTGTCCCGVMLCGCQGSE